MLPKTCLFVCFFLPCNESLINAKNIRNYKKKMSKYIFFLIWKVVHSKYLLVCDINQSIIKANVNHFISQASLNIVSFC